MKDVSITSFFRPFQTNEPAIRTRSSAARTGAVFRSCGCATSTTTAETTRTSRRTCVASGTVRPGGRVAQASPTIGAFRSGCSATVRTTVGTTAMNCRRTAPSATRRRTSSVTTTDAFRSKWLRGCSTGGVDNRVFFVFVSQAMDVRLRGRLRRWK